MRQTTQTYKPRLLELKFLERLKEANCSILKSSRRDYIPFPIVFEKICRCFSIKKQEAWQVLYEFERYNFIRIIKFHGVEVLEYDK